MTFWECIERGEYVMLALGILLLVIIIVWWVSGLRIAKGGKGYGMLMQRVRDHIVEGDLENAANISENPASPGGAVLAAGISHIGHSIAEIREAMKGVSTIECQKMNRGLIWLRLIAVTSPLLGLGGTLTGIIDRLGYLAKLGNVDSAAICGALSPTIVTTVVGLGVGIFSLIALVSLESMIKKSERKLEELQLDFISLLEEPAH
ncbi:MAG: MotA/TolQ/ExbB proton channel family protein [Muribaculaceae bacterium]|nr:MotA/TolQ/ExbB proton channel family protein [Muribaculaceae bacterium]